MSLSVRAVLGTLPIALSMMMATGCGTPGAPQPPSLNLPDQVTDLSAVRTGDRVSLTWTMPKRNTDKLALKSNVDVRVCRREGNGICQLAAAKLVLGPGEEGRFTDTLPQPLASGEPRALSYFVELRNGKGRSAGLSNSAIVLAGQTPAPVEGLRAEVRKEGVVLSWVPVAAAGNADVRLHRKLLSPPQNKPKEGLLTPPPEAIETNLLVDSDGQAGRAIDKNVRFGEAYEYRAQRVRRIAANGKTLELAGDLSFPIRVEARDIFPPAVPRGLVAVAAAGENGAGPAIDLSWNPDTDRDVAGYIVYRREGEGDWQRISSAEPVIGPAFHDAEVHAGRTYQYAVSAVSQTGHESARSAESAETVPNP
jgi:hypothetical protein